MLPNRLILTRQAEERLKREKQRSGKPPNILARELFFQSIENGNNIKSIEEFDSGAMSMDKKTWLGDTEAITEHILHELYPNSSAEDKAKFWALLIDQSL